MTTNRIETGNRALLLGLLETYLPEDKRDAGTRDEVARFVLENQNCFERTLLSGHVTGSAWVANIHCNRILLTRHTKLNRWLQLGGHADGCSDVQAVALREAQEESGLNSLAPWSADIFDLDIHPIPAREKEQTHLHYDIRFAFSADDNEQLVVSAESRDLRWVELDDISSLTSEESILRMVRKWVGRKKSLQQKL